VGSSSVAGSDANVAASDLGASVVDSGDDEVTGDAGDEEATGDYSTTGDDGDENVDDDNDSVHQDYLVGTGADGLPEFGEDFGRHADPNQGGDTGDDDTA
jgi:hypothetical protein